MCKRMRKRLNETAKECHECRELGPRIVVTDQWAALEEVAEKNEEASSSPEAVSSEWEFSSGEEEQEVSALASDVEESQTETN